MVVRFRAHHSSSVCRNTNRPSERFPLVFRAIDSAPRAPSHFARAIQFSFDVLPFEERVCFSCQVIATLDGAI